MFWRKPPPLPPIPFYRKPAVVSIILTVIIVFVLGPVGFIFNGMTEELKSMKGVDKENQGAIIQNQLAIKELLTRQQMIMAPKNVKVMKAIKLKVKKLTPTEYVSFINMSSAQQALYKKYRTDITVWP